MYMEHADNIPNQAVHDEGAEKTTIRWLIGKPQGAPSFAMRLIEVQPGAKPPSIRTGSNTRYMCWMAMARYLVRPKLGHCERGVSFSWRRMRNTTSATRAIGPSDSSAASRCPPRLRARRAWWPPQASSGFKTLERLKAYALAGGLAPVVGRRAGVRYGCLPPFHFGHRRPHMIQCAHM